VFADLIDGPLAHLPPGRFGANSARVLCAAITHNLLRAAGVLAGDTLDQSTGLDPSAHDHQRSRPTGPAPAPTDSAYAHPLALVQTLAPVVAQHHRTQPRTDRDILTNRRQAQPDQTRKAGQTNGYAIPARDNQDQSTSKPFTSSPSVDRG
jgi:hypothetical protein